MGFTAGQAVPVCPEQTEGFGGNRKRGDEEHPDREAVRLQSHAGKKNQELTVRDNQMVFCFLWFLLWGEHWR